MFRSWHPCHTDRENGTPWNPVCHTFRLNEANWLSVNGHTFMWSRWPCWSDIPECKTVSFDNASGWGQQTVELSSEFWQILRVNRLSEINITAALMPNGLDTIPRLYIYFFDALTDRPERGIRQNQVDPTEDVLKRLCKPKQTFR